MKTSNYALHTLKKISNETNTLNYHLMIRAGIIRKVSSGLYSWMPTGLRVIKKIQSIIRQELKKINAIEISMPILQPETLWKKSGRWNSYGKELLKVYDRRNKVFVLSPTHEEIITSLIHQEITSYKQLPTIWYQINTKFRDEIRPRFGVIRSKEFLMKDAYSFHLNNSCLNNTYKKMQQLYSNIFNLINIKFKIVEANSNNMGGTISHEFQAISNLGEDKIAFSNNSSYASNVEITPIKKNASICKNIHYYNNYIHNNQNLFQKLNKIPLESLDFEKSKTIVNTFIAKYNINKTNYFVALLIKKKHQLNLSKLKNLTFFPSPITLATKQEIYELLKINDSSIIGPIGLSIPLISDIEVSTMKNFSVKANLKNFYFIGVNWIRDLKQPRIADIRNVINGDESPDNLGGKLIVSPSIEVGHIFKIGSIYSKRINTYTKNKKKEKIFLKMGCYGIGISRLVSTIIEQHHDKYGIIWPDSVAPFNVAIIPVNFHKSKSVKQFSQSIYKTLNKKNIDTLLDDRKEYLGKIFSDIELIGIPHIIIIGKKNILNNQVEYRNRKTKKNQLISIHKIISFIQKKLL